jgi:hypothetical protein
MHCACPFALNRVGPSSTLTHAQNMLFTLRLSVCRFVVTWRQCVTHRNCKQINSSSKKVFCLSLATRLSAVSRRRVNRHSGEKHIKQLQNSGFPTDQGFAVFLRPLSVSPLDLELCRSSWSNANRFSRNFVLVQLWGCWQIQCSPGR